MWFLVFLGTGTLPIRHRNQYWPPQLIISRLHKMDVASLVFSKYCIEKSGTFVGRSKNSVFVINRCTGYTEDSAVLLLRHQTLQIFETDRA